MATPPVKLSALYTAELWRNIDGGIRTGWRYLDNLDLTLTVDGEQALGWHGATFFVYGLYNNGHAFSGDLVGDAQTVSNIETGVKAARLYEAWIEQRFAGDHASLKLGLYDLNSEFDTTDVVSLSLLSSHGIGPEFGQSGRSGPSIFPVTSLALRAEANRYNRIRRYAGGGLVYTGLVRPEQDDRVGVTIARAWFGQPFLRSIEAANGAPRSAETVVEITYRSPLAKWLTVQPDLQYIVHPGPTRTAGHALVTGVRVELGF